MQKAPCWILSLPCPISSIFSLKVQCQALPRKGPNASGSTTATWQIKSYNMLDSTVDQRGPLGRLVPEFKKTDQAALLDSFVPCGIFCLLSLKNQALSIEALYQCQNECRQRRCAGCGELAQLSTRTTHLSPQLDVVAIQPHCCSCSCRFR